MWNLPRINISGHVNHNLKKKLKVTQLAFLTTYPLMNASIHVLCHRLWFPITAVPLTSSASILMATVAMFSSG
jgi:hypothetical protein